jgi:hypothetical protein
MRSLRTLSRLCFEWYLSLLKQLTSILRCLGSASRGITLRMVDGSAKEWLWELKGDPNPAQTSMVDAQEFVKQLVHATFKDKGCVVGNPASVPQRCTRAYATIATPACSAVATWRASQRRLSTWRSNAMGLDGGLGVD